MGYYNYKVPNKKKWLLTDQFLIDFKNELDSVFEVQEEDSPNYFNTYSHLEGTGGFYTALKNASLKHNVSNAIYEYARRLPWYKGDSFDYELSMIMIERGIIVEGDIDAINKTNDEELVEMERNGEIRWIEKTVQYNGYSITKKEWEYIL